MGHIFIILILWHVVSCFLIILHWVLLCWVRTAFIYVRHFNFVFNKWCVCKCETFLIYVNHLCIIVWMATTFNYNTNCLLLCSICCYFYENSLMFDLDLCWQNNTHPLNRLWCLSWKIFELVIKTTFYF